MEFGDRLKRMIVRVLTRKNPKALIEISSSRFQIGSVYHRITLACDLRLAFRAFCPSSRSSAHYC
jgi:hypothetical protein